MCIPKNLQSFQFICMYQFYSRIMQTYIIIYQVYLYMYTYKCSIHFAKRDADEDFPDSLQDGFHDACFGFLMNVKFSLFSYYPDFVCHFVFIVFFLVHTSVKTGVHTFSYGLQISYRGSLVF